MENGKIAFIDELPTEAGFGSTEFFVLRAVEEVTAEYIYYHLNSDEFRQVAAQAMTGASGHRRVPKSFLETLRFPLPPLSVQKKIVKAIEAVDAEETQAHQTLETTRQAVEAEINKITTRQRIAEVCELVKDKVEPDASPDDHFFFVGLEHIESGSGYLLEPGLVKGSQLQSTKSVFAPNDVLYGKLRPYLNKVAIACCDGICSTDILVLRTPQPVLLQTMLLRQAFVDSTQAKMKGTNHPRIGVDDFMQSEIPWPDSAQQQALLETITTHEAKRREAETILAAAAGQKRRILLDGIK
jgi:restriction endonuclease S subunit